MSRHSVPDPAAFWEWDALRRVFLDDQAAGAHEEAAELFARMAGGRGVDYSRVPSPWVLRLVRKARRIRCSHAPREGSQLVFVPAHVGQMLCRRCAARARKTLGESPDGVRCDVCREVAELERFAFHAGSTLLVTGRCCAVCRATVYGGLA